MSYIENEDVNDVISSKINDKYFEDNRIAAEYRKNYVEESYRLTIMASRINLLEARQAALTPKEVEQLSELSSRYVFLSRNRNHIKPAGHQLEKAQTRRYTSGEQWLTPAEGMTLEKATHNLLQDIGYEIE